MRKKRRILFPIRNTRDPIAKAIKARSRRRVEAKDKFFAMLNYLE